MCRHCSADPSFRGFDLRVSPLGAPVVFAARGDLPFRRLPLGGLVLLPSASGFPSASWPSGSLLRFSARAASELPLGGLAFGLTASAFRHAPLRGCPRRVGASAFRFGDCRSASWPSDSRLPLFGMRRFGVAAGRVGLRAHDFRFSACAALGLPLGGLAFGLTASAFRHAPLRSCRWASWFCRLPFRRLPLGELAFGLTTSAFGMHRSAPPRRRSEGRRSTPTRHLFHFKTLISTC